MTLKDCGLMRNYRIVNLLKLKNIIVEISFRQYSTVSLATIQFTRAHAKVK